MTEVEQIIKALDDFENAGRSPMWAVFDSLEKVDIGKLCQAAHDLVNNPRIGSVSKIEVPIQDVGEYELVLTLKLKK